MRKKSPLFYKQPDRPSIKPKRKWIILPFLWRTVKYVCLSLGAMILISTVLGMIFVGTFLEKSNTGMDMPDQMILYYKLDGEIYEGPPPSGLDAFGPPKISMEDIIKSLNFAATDDRVKAFILSVRSSLLNVSQIQELRQAVQEFKTSSNKPAYIFSMSYGETGQGIGLYSLASAFDEIWLSPLGTLSVNGIRLEQPYLRGLLDKYGIQPLFFQREEYKGVFENLTNSEMSEASRESLGDLTKSLVKEFVKDIMSSRENKITSAKLAEYIDTGIFLDTEAEKLGLVDKVEYADVLLDNLRTKLGGSVAKKTPELVLVSDYLNSLEAPLTMPRDIALIYIQGPIMVFNEDEQGQSLMGSSSSSADKIATLIVQAAEDKNVEAIVLRVDSPGGSPAASELIRRAIIRAKKYKKPVIISMGSMAASGGYWISAAGDYIFALPGTLTGSIGVAGGKVSMKEFWSNLNVNWDGVGIGQNADMYSINQPFSEGEEKLMQASMDRIYDMFLGVVAEGRGMDKSSVREVAKGRVWSGAQALEKGLVDQMGSLNDALDYAALKAGYDDRHDVNIVTLPKPKTALEEILELLGQPTAALSPFMKQQVGMGAFFGKPQQEKFLQDAAVLSNGGNVFVYEPMPILR